MNVDAAELANFALVAAVGEVVEPAVVPVLVSVEGQIPVRFGPAEHFVRMGSLHVADSFFAGRDSVG